MGTLVPLLGMLWITWSLTLSDGQAVLADTARHMLTRADRAASDARRSLDTLAQTRLIPCSPEHIDLMRQLVFNSRTIEEVGYFDDGLLACTSWGVVDTPIPFRPPDFETREGLGVTVGVRPMLPGGAVKLALSAGNYNVLIDPFRFIDVLTDPDVLVGLATADGQIVARTYGAPDALVTELAQAPETGMDAAYAFNTVRSDDWTAIALEPRPHFLSVLRQEQLLLLPIGLFMAGLIIALIVWQSRQRLSLQAEIATAVRRGEFEVHYQPIVELAGGRCVGAEALLRWRLDGRWVSPALFIPVAEQSGLIGELTALVIRHVGRDLGRALAQNPALHVSINFAPDDLKTDAALSRLDALTATHRIAPAQVWIEVTERGFMDYAATRETITLARDKGYRLSIDDFGTGYSSLTHLQQITFDTLKIDKSFVDTIGVPSAKSAVIFHIIEMAKALGVTIIAEGVESEAQATYLRENGVTLAQGWLYARAMPAKAFIAYLGGKAP